MKKLAILVCLLGLSGQALATNWVIIGRDNNETLYGDTDSRTNDQAWIKSFLIKPEKSANGKYYKESKYLFQVKCSGNQISLLSEADYSHSGKVVNSVTVPSYRQSWEYIIPETVGERIYNFICKHEPM